MRVLVVGAGGREHALAWKLSQDSASSHLYAAPGNPGTAELAENVPIASTDIERLVDFAEHSRIDLTVVGPEVPLAAGLVDAVKAKGLRIFGPTRAAARLEASKVFAKDLMRRHSIPTAAFEVFTSPLAATAYVQGQRRPLVIKADGLAGGKGVIVAQTPDGAQQAIEDMMIRGMFGDAGRHVVIEECLEGTEVSLLVLVGPGGVTPLIPAKDYKRALDGDHGPNTGGMGAVAPVDLVPGTDLAGILYRVPLEQIMASIVEPVVAAMRREGRPYTGVLYVGLMLTVDGPKVLEFNCRFGDPEAQVILPLLESDLGEAMLAVLAGESPRLTWRSGHAVCVVPASGGYPGSHTTGHPIHGLDSLPRDVVVFQAGTRLEGSRVVTAGGRVLNVVGLGETRQQAVDRAYAGVSRIAFEGMQFRTDIGRLVTPAVATGASA